MSKEEIKEDLERARKALNSAERNFQENDYLTAANRTFVACENSVYALLKIKLGSASLSRIKILTRLKEINSELKALYDQSYDLRVQADYGREARTLPLNRENLEKTLDRVRDLVFKVKKKLGEETT